MTVPERWQEVIDLVLAPIAWIPRMQEALIAFFVSPAGALDHGPRITSSCSSRRCWRWPRCGSRCCRSTRCRSGPAASGTCR